MDSGSVRNQPLVLDERKQALNKSAHHEKLERFDSINRTQALNELAPPAPPTEYHSGELRADHIAVPPTSDAANITDVIEKFLDSGAPEFHARLLGQTIARSRKQLGLSQSRVAASLGLNQCTISHIESGKRNVTMNTLHKVCKEVNLEAIIVPRYMVAEILRMVHERA